MFKNIYNYKFNVQVIEFDRYEGFIEREIVLLLPKVTEEVLT